MSKVSHDVNSALNEILGENIGSIIKKLASIQEVANQMNDELGDGAGDRLDSELFDLIDCLTEALQCYILDAVDAQLLKDNFQDIHASLSSCASCIRDGIEKNYDSWDEWQSIARQVLWDNVPDVARDLDSYQDVTSLSQVINSPKVINSPSEKNERKGK